MTPIMGMILENVTSHVNSCIVEYIEARHCHIANLQWLFLRAEEKEGRDKPYVLGDDLLSGVGEVKVD